MPPRSPGVVWGNGRAFWLSCGLDRVWRALWQGCMPEVSAGAPAALGVGAPATRPGKVVCICSNYRDYAKATGAPIPSHPVAFMKDPCIAVDPNGGVLTPCWAVKTDWDVERAVTIGNRGCYLSFDAEALDAVGGFGCSSIPAGDAQGLPGVAELVIGGLGRQRQWFAPA